MEHYAVIDVSLEWSSVCVVDAAGQIVSEAKVRSEVMGHGNHSQGNQHVMDQGHHAGDSKGNILESNPDIENDPDAGGEDCGKSLPLSIFGNLAANVAVGREHRLLIES